MSNTAAGPQQGTNEEEIEQRVKEENGEADGEEVGNSGEKDEIKSEKPGKPAEKQANGILSNGNVSPEPEEEPEDGKIQRFFDVAYRSFCRQIDRHILLAVEGQRGLQSREPLDRRFVRGDELIWQSVVQRAQPQCSCFRDFKMVNFTFRS